MQKAAKPGFSRMTKILAAIALALGLGVAAGIVVERQLDFTRRAAGNIERNWDSLSKATGLYSEPDVREVTRRTISTFFYDLVEYTLRLGPFDGFDGGRGGSIAEFGNGLIFVAPKGHVGYVSNAGTVRYEKFRVPMNLQAFVDWVDTGGQSIHIHYFRTLDTRIVTKPSGATSLFVSHHRFTGNCVEFVVSAIDVTLGNDGPVYDAAGWRDVYVAKPCVELPPKARGFEGLESGGRLVQVAPNRILMSIGHFGFDGNYMGPAVSMDPNVDLGKILELDLDTGKTSVISIGHRNPQGLMRDSAGRIWSTEHGPRGGDELNLIIPGRNYGWPETSYGLHYEVTREDLEHNPKLGRHDGNYERPRYFFAPSVGISNLIEADGDEFAAWRGDLLVTSLDGSTIFRMRLDDNHVVSSEAIEIGERIRDIISMRDHRIALLTDKGNIKILARARLPGEAGPAPPPASISGFAAIAETRKGDKSLGRQLSGYEHGRRLFSNNCASCHSLDGSASVGPTLRGVFKRRIGSLEGYAYSAAMREAKGEWNEVRLHAFIADAQAEIPGTKMPNTQVYYHDIWPLVTFLQSAD